jgi:peptidoglycan-associated lipoprotein
LAKTLESQSGHISQLTTEYAVFTRLTKNIILLLIGITLSGCNAFYQKDPDVIVTTEPMLTKSDGDSESSVDKIKSAENVNLDSVASKGFTLGNNVIYFEYDKYSIDNDNDKEILKRYSDYMRKYKKAQIRIEGHADERGSRAYNLALGEKRAETIKEILLINGVKKDAVEVVSYGEENPAVIGTNEDTHSLNRRVEIVFSNTGK